MTHARAVAVLGLLLVGLLLTGCASEPQGANADPDQVDSTALPDPGACRSLTPEDVAQPANATAKLRCSEEHTAQTYAVGELPEELDDAEIDDPEVAAYAGRACAEEFESFLGADSSLALRTFVSWVWFRPSEQAWTDGARWYRCDVVGGPSAGASYVPLPRTAKGLLEGRPEDRWLICARGPSVSEGEKVPCSEQHDWRAVSTIKLGEPDDTYPGDEQVESLTRDYCSKSVRAWLNYPAQFEYGFTWFHEPEWAAGNRLSVCWAKTDE